MIARFAAAALATTLLAACAAPIAERRAAEPVTVGILAINDFHGALEPPKRAVMAPDGKGGTVAVPAGGAAWLASALDSLRAKYPNHVTVAAGDLIGASQFASSIHLDEPAIGVLDRIGLEFAAVGNHEFDQGRAELLRKQNGGCERHARRAPCQVERFAGARFRYLAASTFTEDGGTLFPATAIKRFGRGARQVAVGFIGLTLKDTSRLVSPDGVRGLTFGDEAEAINAAVPRLKAAGADAIVVLIHEGGKTGEPPDPDGCSGLTGDILPILARVDPRVDVVVSGHSHWAYVCDHGAIDPARPFLLTSAGSYGQLVTDITLEIDPAAGRVVARRAGNLIVQSPGYAAGSGTVAETELHPRFAPRADVAAYVQRYVEAARDAARRPAGRLAGPAAKPSAQTNLGGPLGNLIADAQLAATRGAGAQIALTNPFGIRAPLTPAPDGMLTYAELHAAQPFANVLITRPLTGAEIRAALEQGLDGDGPEQLLAPSAGFAYAYDRARPPGRRIVGITLDGAPLREDATYRVTVNSFLASGGDGFTAFAVPRLVAVGMTDTEALEAWLMGASARAVPMEERVVEVSGAAARAK